MRNKIIPYKVLGGIIVDRGVDTEELKSGG
jgi:hypothetical protein